MHLSLSTQVCECPELAERSVGLKAACSAVLGLAVFVDKRSQLRKACAWRC